MIGILDSGLGGLSVLNEIHHLLPQQSLIYVGDSAWCPYGNKTYQEIQTRVTNIVDFLITQGAQTIVIACNSATIACVEHLRSVYPIPIIGMEPGVKPASQLTKNGKIGVFATEASLAGAKFHRLVSTHAVDVEVITQPCPKYVELVEQGILSGEPVVQAIQEYAEPMISRGVDTIVLGCTHYPFLTPEILKLYPSLNLVDTGAAVARQVERKSAQAPSLTPPAFSFYTSGETSHSTQLLSILSPSFSDFSFKKLQI